MFNYRLHYVAYILILLISSVGVNAQNIILANAYAHNDYWHKHPLFDALDKGFIYVEADVFVKNNKLVVAHYFLSKKNKSLEDLYLKPLLKYVEENKKTPSFTNDYTITIMIDIKSGANKTYKVLAILLEKYKSILTEYNKDAIITRSVTIVLSGHKPTTLFAKTDDRFIFLDDNLKDLGKDSCNYLYKTASCKYDDLMKWKGRGPMPDSDRLRLEHYVTKAHAQGKKVRLWASPENKAVWTQLLKCNVDLINTDKLSTLRNFLISELSLTAKHNNY